MFFDFNQFRDFIFQNLIPTSILQTFNLLIEQENLEIHWTQILLIYLKLMSKTKL